MPARTNSLALAALETLMHLGRPENTYALNPVHFVEGRYHAACRGVVHSCIMWGGEPAILPEVKVTWGGEEG